MSINPHYTEEIWIAPSFIKKLHDVPFARNIKHVADLRSLYLYLLEEEAHCLEDGHSPERITGIPHLEAKFNSLLRDLQRLGLLRFKVSDGDHLIDLRAEGQDINPMRMTMGKRCELCDKISPRSINHHTRYIPEQTIEICGSCHYHIHHDKDTELSKLQPEMDSGSWKTIKAAQKSMGVLDEEIEDYPILKAMIEVAKKEYQKGVNNE